MDRVVTYVGQFEGSGAYPTLNRHLASGLEKRGWRVLRNVHNDGATITPYAITSVYPPQPVTLRHNYNLCLSTWEFLGKQAAPRSFIEAFQTYDRVWAFCRQAATVFQQNGAQNVTAGYLGVDPAEFTPDGAMEGRYNPFGVGKRIILWAGGTDARHGFDLAVKALDFLPDNCYLIAKQSAYYPAAEAHHRRLRIVHDDLPSLAPLYRNADVLLHSARAVAPGMTVIEALACGTKVVSTDLPAVREVRYYEATRPYITLVPGKIEHMRHHLHQDCNPCWVVPEPRDLANAIKTALNKPQMTHAEAKTIGALFSWSDAAHHLEQTMLGRL